MSNGASAAPANSAAATADTSTMPSTVLQQPQHSTASATVTGSDTMDTTESDLHSHSLSTSTFDTHSDRLMQFLARSETQHHFSTAVAEYTEISASWKSSDTALKAFIADCTKEDRGITLPVRLRWRLKEKLHLNPVPDNEAFYEQDLAELEQIRKEAHEKAYRIIIRAKTKHVAELRTKVNVPTFIARKVEPFRKFVTQAAVEFDNLYNLYSPQTSDDAASSTLPAAAAAQPLADNTRRFIDSAVEAFMAHMHRSINSHLLDRSINTVTDSERKATEKEDNHKAQETVVAGAHTGQTINTLIERHMKPIVQSVQRLQQQRYGNAAPSASISATTAATVTSPRSVASRASGKKHARDSSPRSEADVFATTDNPGRSVNRGGKKAFLNPGYAHRSHRSHDNASPAAATSASASASARRVHLQHFQHFQQQPTNGEGGGRSSTHQRQNASYVPRGGTQRGRGRGRGKINH
jgi:hypothetical protein